MHILFEGYFDSFELFDFQELFLVYRQNDGGKKGKASKLEVCPTCKQVLVPEDLASHVEEHAVEQHFPKLSK